MLRRFGDRLLVPFGTLLLGNLACGDDVDSARGSLNVLLEAEDAVIDGLLPGDGTEDVRDGWSVTFDKYIVTIGEIGVQLSSDRHVAVAASELFTVDMTRVPAAGLRLWEIDELRAGRWEFNYALGSADRATRHRSVGSSDFDDMVDSGWTYYVEGTLTKQQGESCPPARLATPGDKQPNGNTSGENDCYATERISFVFGAQTEVSFGPCEIDGIPGFSVPAGGAQTVAATIHGDHLFFNGFPEGSEGGVDRRAQWLADCDLDLDGNVTLSELESIAPAQLPALESYQLGGAPLEPVNMYAYVRAQLLTQGHFQGEGECAMQLPRSQ